jgi:hypothetical protein
MKTIWSLYAFIGLLLVFMPMLINIKKKYKKDIIKKVWIIYLFLGACLGFFTMSKKEEENDDNNNIENFSSNCSTCS